jgi:hypothetical protein
MATTIRPGQVIRQICHRQPFAKLSHMRIFCKRLTNQVLFEARPMRTRAAMAARPQQAMIRNCLLTWCDGRQPNGNGSQA